MIRLMSGYTQPTLSSGIVDTTQHPKDRTIVSVFPFHSQHEVFIVEYISYLKVSMRLFVCTGAAHLTPPLKPSIMIRSHYNQASTTFFI